MRVESMEQVILVASFLFILAFIAKLCDSTLGLGYGTILAPSLIIAGYPIRHIVPAVLFSEFTSAALTALAHRFRGTISSHPLSRDFKVSTVLSFMGIIGAVCGVLVATSFIDLFITVYVGLTVIITGTLIVRGFGWKFSWKRLSLMGFVASVNKGLSGGGYGPIIAGGQILSGRDEKRAIASTSTAEAVTTATSWGLYVILGQVVPSWDSFLALEIPLALGAILSAPFAAILIHKIEPSNLIPFVGSGAIIIGVYIVMKSLVGDLVAIGTTIIVFTLLFYVISTSEYRRRKYPKSEQPEENIIIDTQPADEEIDTSEINEYEEN
jgi:uncharacterized membrane protein YfcA